MNSGSNFEQLQMNDRRKTTIGTPNGTPDNSDGNIGMNNIGVSGRGGNRRKTVGNMQLIGSIHSMGASSTTIPSDTPDNSDGNIGNNSNARRKSVMRTGSNDNSGGYISAKPKKR